MKTIRILLFVPMLFLAGCSSPTESQYNPPSDHTVDKHGARHKSGLEKPLTNCVECHGSDLKGGSVGVSCYHCHGKKW